MREKLVRSAVISVSFGLFLSAYGAISIELAGDGDGYDITGTEVQSFRSTDVEKGGDVIDGDNVYGTDGYFFFGVGGPSNVNSQAFSFSTNDGPSWVTGYAEGVNFGSVAQYDTYTTIDDPTLPPGVDVADWERSAIGLSTLGGVGTWSELMTFTVDASAPANYRVGIMAGNEPSPDGRWDPTGIRLSLDGGTSVSCTNLPVMDATTVGMVFFDITTDGSVGTLIIEGQQRQAARGPSIVGITFDAGIGSDLPEPPDPVETAVVITAVGSSEGYAETNLPAYRSTGVPKLYDFDLNNEYGTEGVFAFGTDGEAGNNKPWAGNITTNGAPWVTSYDPGADFLSISEQPDYGPYDNPLLSGTNVADVVNAAIAVATGGGVGLWAEVMTFTLDDSAPQNFRVGIMSGNQDTPDGRWDPSGLRLSIAGTETDTAISTITDLPNNGTNLCEWVFFDVNLNGQTSNLIFSVEGQNRLSGQGTAISVITFDVYVDLSPPIVSIETLSASNIELSWTSVDGVTYGVQGRERMTIGSWTTIDSNLAATPPENTYTQAVDSAAEFYQVFIEE